MRVMSCIWYRSSRRSSKHLKSFSNNVLLFCFLEILLPKNIHLQISSVFFFIPKISFAWLLFYSNLSLTLFCLMKLRFFLFREQSVCFIAKNKKKLICINFHSYKLSAKAKREKLIKSFIKSPDSLFPPLSLSHSIAFCKLYLVELNWCKSDVKQERTKWKNATWICHHQFWEWCHYSTFEGLLDV